MPYACREDCEALDGGARVRIQAVPQPGQWVRRAGEDIETGATVLAAGTRLTPAALGLAASIGLARLRVARRPRVALFSTGDELVMPGEVPPERMPPGAIYNSNRFFLRAMLLRLGCEVSDFGIVPDRRDATQQALADAAAAHDLVLTSGGVSVGEEDHVKPAVAALGRIDLWQVALKPGKPFAYGRIGERVHFMGLPGNPASSLVTFAILVRPFLLCLQGVQDVVPRAVEARANFHWPRADKRREFLRVRRDADGGLELFPNQGSGVLTSAAWCDGLVDNPPGRTIARGDTVRFIPPVRSARMTSGTTPSSSPAVTVTVRYFASIREAVGQGSETLSTQAGTVGALRDALIARGGPWAESLARGRAVRTALDQVLCREEAALSEGAEIAFFPPVTGG